MFEARQGYKVRPVSSERKRKKKIKHIKLVIEVPYAREAKLTVLTK